MIILQDLEKLQTFDKLSIEEIESLISDDLLTDELKTYLRTMQLLTKPEAASSDLLKAILSNIKGSELDIYSEVRQKQGGYVDFRLQEQKSNPVLLELKPMFRQIKDKAQVVTGIKYQPLDYQIHRRQIKKYLADNDYLVLTNLREVQLFNRDILAAEEETFKPFREISFIDFLQAYLQIQNFWQLIRRFDSDIKVGLEQDFFEDLATWYAQLTMVKFVETPELSKEELIVLLLNKVIFIKTLEDYGLIGFNFLKESYLETERRWRVKGYNMVFTRFFDEIENWFWEFYDTELFDTPIWDKVEKSKLNIEQFRVTFERVLGFGQWHIAFGKGMLHYDYRKIDEDVFGKAYETFIAQQRKSGGIYYTHRLITSYMTENLVNLLFADKVNQVLTALDKLQVAQAREVMQAILAIKIVDTCSGSGSFLIKVLREIYQFYIKIEEKTRYYAKPIQSVQNDENQTQDMFQIPPIVREIQAFRVDYGLDDKRQLLASIILHHIFAVDVDERALDTAKTNIWKEAIKLEPPVFNYNLLPENKNHILPNLTLNFINADGLYDLPLEWQLTYLATQQRETIVRLQQIRANYVVNMNQPELLVQVHDIKVELRKAMLAACEESLFHALSAQCKPLLLGIEFFYCYFDSEGVVLDKDFQGFDGIVSNPPWETIKPIQKEFAKQGKYGMDVVDFTKWFKEKLEEDEDFAQNWQNYSDFYKSYSDFLRQTYKFQGIGDLNYYKFFIERDVQLLKPQGFLSILVPSGIQTDKGCAPLRELLIKHNTLSALYSFENRGFLQNEDDEHKVKIFPDVDNRFKFSIINMQKQQHVDASYDFAGLFYLHHPRQLEQQPIVVNAKMIEQFSPESFSIMEFRTQQDYDLCKKIRSDYKLLGDFDYKLRREFDMSNDRNLFLKQKTAQTWALFEGKTIYQYDSQHATPRYFINSEQALDILAKKEVNRIKRQFKGFSYEDFINKQFRVDCQNYKLVYREIACSTNERTLIASILPPQVFTGHKLHYFVNYSYFEENGEIHQKQISNAELVFMLGLFNSLVLNYYLRNRISTQVSFFFTYELPIPSVESEIKQQIIEKSFLLLYCKSQSERYEALREELGIDEINCEKLDLIQIRAELEILIAKQLYQLDSNEWTYLTSTFIYGGDSSTKQELDKIIATSRQNYA